MSLLRGASLVALLGAITALSGAGGLTASSPQLTSRQSMLSAADAVATVDDDPRAVVRGAAAARYPTVPGVLAVKFSPEASERQVARVIDAAGGTRARRLAHADFTLVQLPEGVAPEDAATRIAGEAGVIYAEPVARRHPLYRPNDPLYEFQWNMQRIGLERAWDINRGGDRDVVVAVIDTGVAYRTQGEFAQAPDLAGTTFVPGYDFIWEDDAPFDLDGHGTHVTGTVAQTTNNNVGTAGIAFNVSIMPIKALSSEWDIELGAPNPGTSATTAQAIRFAVDHGAKVINLSLGGEVGSTAEREALLYAVERGVVVVAAAGNEGDAGSPPSYPAAYAKDIDGVIAVGAVDYALQRPPYSNVNDYVELAAPGGDIRADLNDDGYGDGVLQQTLDFDAVARSRFNEFGYFFLTGTSMASPHVAALAALLVDQGISKPAAVEAALARFATDLGPGGRDNEYGHGLINPRATLRGLGLSR